jgi:hypothetical protein
VLSRSFQIINILGISSINVAESLAVELFILNETWYDISKTTKYFT